MSRIGWMRAAVLGANDGIVSTASLIVGVAAAGSSKSAILIAGGAGLVAGALSMAAGEYVSVSSQSDTEKADLAREAEELATNPEAEHHELAGIYISRGLTPDLAVQVATQLMARDALGAHARDELGISEITTARPIQAAWTSAASFAVQPDPSAGQRDLVDLPRRPRCRRCPGGRSRSAASGGQGRLLGRGGPGRHRRYRHGVRDRGLEGANPVRIARSFYRLRYIMRNLALEI